MSNLDKYTLKEWSNKFKEEKELRINKNNSKNKGGSTSYYDIPKGAKTLNDLIEFKNMNPNLHEMFKAIYAIDERSKRNIEGQDRLRELNKIKYYCEREIALELRKQDGKS